jgi:hypothetical protein
MKRGWFGPKIIGWGIGPRTREGWLVTGGFAAAMFAVRLSPLPVGVARAAEFTLLAGLLIVICLTYSRHPRP